MAVSFVAAASANVGGSSFVTVSVPTGTADGNVMVANLLVSSPSHVPSTPSGWTALDSEATGPSVQSYWKIASSEPANYTFSFTAGNAGSAIISTYSGNHATTPINVHGAWLRTASTVAASASSVTTNVDGCMLVYFGGVGQAATFTGPTSYTQRATASGNGIANVVADLLQATQGATGVVVATSSISGNVQGSMIAIAPPTTASTDTPELMLMGVGS